MNAAGSRPPVPNSEPTGILPSSDVWYLTRPYCVRRRGWPVPYDRGVRPWRRVPAPATRTVGPRGPYVPAGLLPALLHVRPDELLRVLLEHLVDLVEDR